ncbi:MAG: M60 family peptidase N-terminal accessory domain-containing protein, partial [Proteiniphilum sp.]
MNKLLFVFLITLIPFFSHCQSKTPEIIDSVELPKKGEYVPVNSNGIDSDLQIRPTSGIASDAHPGYGIERSFDGDLSSMYHSPWYSLTLPVTLEYKFSDAKDIDYIVYHPRTGGGNGDFGKFELWVSTETTPDFVKQSDYDFKMKGTASVINFEKTIEGIRAFKFIVESGRNDFASCAEMEFYRKVDRSDLNLNHIFADDVYSQLRTGVTLEQINAIENDFFKNLAQSIFTEDYPMEFRVQEYEPYPLIETTAKELKTSGYNPFENPTGMYFSSGDEIVIIMGDSKGEDISFRIHNFGNHADASFILRPGVNKIRAKNSGLGYISYYTDNWRNVQPVKIHITSGKVNGYFDRNKHKREDWRRLIDGAVSSYFDIKGYYINLAYTSQDLREYCSNGMDLIEVYDEIVEI